VSSQTLAQRRAAHALARIQAHKQAGRAAYGNYVSYAEALPATIVMNGLGQACATLLAKAEGDLRKPHGLLYADLQSWLCRDDTVAPYARAANLMQAIVNNDQKRYLHAQTEALAYLAWLKKFACAFLERGTDQ